MLPTTSLTCSVREPGVGWSCINGDADLELGAGPKLDAAVEVFGPGVSVTGD